MTESAPPPDSVPPPPPLPERRGMAADLVDFLKANRNWWLIPILAVLLLVGALLILSTTAAGPFIYTLF